MLCGDIGLVVLSGLGSRRTHPVGVEGATMARRVPFPPSSIPAYIEQSMKLFVCLVRELAPSVCGEGASSVKEIRFIQSHEQRQVY